MDTRLRKFKYSFFTKFMCWLIAIVLFCFAFTVAVEVATGCYVLGPENFFKGNAVSYFDTNPFLTQFQTDFFSGSTLGRQDSKEFQKLVKTAKETAINEVLVEYLEQRGSIIEQELTYAVENWDTEYYAYEDDVVEAEVTQENGNMAQMTTEVYHQSSVPETTDAELTLPANADAIISVPYYAPKNIKLASYALNTCQTPSDYNKYAGLVRDDAFSGEFYCHIDVDADLETYLHDVFGFGFGVPFNAYYTFNEEQAKAQFSKQYDECAAAAFSENEYLLESKARLSKRENLKYYIVDFDGNIYSNVKEIPTNLSNNNHYVLANEDNVTVKGFALSNIKDSLKRGNVKTLCLYFDESFTGNDVYSNYYNVYQSVVSGKAKELIIEFVALLALFFVMLIIWFMLIGNNSKHPKPVTSFIEKVPNDIHTALSAGAIFGLVFLFGEFIEGFYYDNDVLIPTNDHIVITCAFLILALIVLTEWLASVVRTKKAGESWFKNTLIYKLIRGIIRLLKVFSKKVTRRLVKEFSYRPKAYKTRFALLFAGYALMNLAYATVAVIFSLAEAFVIIVPVMALFFIAFNALVGYYVVRYVNNLDKIIDASSKHENVVFEEKDVPDSLKLLASNLSDKNDALDKAVAEAVKNEQMKTQLITNVSHDLKTPLTSLISYSDLLTKCDVSDEDAKKYIDVINQQSVKLKRLIEDLIEASKVSTGNVTLNKINLNLSELAVQAIVEYTPDFEKNRNEVKFSEPEKAPVVFADGTKTYRIISNLLSNAKKYSATDTRVYISVYTEGDFGCFEIKNVSKEPLNISPEQLTERFVRGDESRSKEGNGLGLSIAKDLCELQDGTLELKIDGDLFKAVVKLPVKE